jgi:hypothetical protein
VEMSQVSIVSIARVNKREKKIVHGVDCSTVKEVGGAPPSHGVCHAGQSENGTAHPDSPFGRRG